MNVARKVEKVAKRPKQSRALRRNYKEKTPEENAARTSKATEAAAQKAAQRKDAAAVLRSIEAFKGLVGFDPERPETLAGAVLSCEVGQEVYALALVALSLFAPFRVRSFVVDPRYPRKPWVEGESGDLVSIWANPKAADDLAGLTSWSTSEAKRKGVVRSLAIPKHERADRVVTESRSSQNAESMLAELADAIAFYGPVMGMGGDDDA